jgi:hypothetical protein
MQLLAARDGKFSGGPPPYGYRLVDDPVRVKRLVPDGHKAEVVKFLFRRFEEGASLGQLAEELAQRGVLSPKGSPRWARNVIRQLLRNRKYVGDWVWGVQAMGKRHRHGGNGTLTTTRRGGQRYERVPPEGWVIRPDSHEPLIDRDLFERVQARLKENRLRTTPHLNGGTFVMTRLLICGHCGSYLLGTSRKGKHRVYQCGGYIRYGRSHCGMHTTPEAPLLRLLIRKLQEAFLDPDNLKRLRDEARSQEAAERGGDNLARLNKLDAQLGEKIRRGEDRLLEVSRESLPGAEAALARLRKERLAVQDELRRVKASRPVEDLEKAIAGAESVLWALQEAIREEDYPQLRQVLREAFDRVELFWTHKTTAKMTRSHLERGVIYVRPQAGMCNLSADGGR